MLHLPTGKGCEIATVPRSGADLCCPEAGFMASPCTAFNFEPGILLGWNGIQFNILGYTGGSHVGWFGGAAGVLQHAVSEFSLVHLKTAHQAPLLVFSMSASIVPSMGFTGLVGLRCLTCWSDGLPTTVGGGFTSYDGYKNNWDGRCFVCCCSDMKNQ